MKQRFIQSFPNSGIEQAAIDNKELGIPYVAYIEDGNYIDWYTQGVDYSKAFTLESQADANTFNITGTSYAYYQLSGVIKHNDGTTEEFSPSQGSVTIDSGDTIVLWTSQILPLTNVNITATKSFKTKGNIMSLVDPNYSAEDAITDLTQVGSSAFTNLFSGSTTLTDASGLLLPATTLSLDCYESLFHGCTSLTGIPELPATTLADYCYIRMFRNCTSLTQVPELPATTLGDYCYSSMFQNCSSLTTAPVLPATELANKCYRLMFGGCTNLATAPVLPATTLADGCYSSMFRYCTSLTQAQTILPATILASGCYENMFNGCTSLTTAPELPATTLARSCYESMFNGCSSLNYIKAMFTTTPTTTYTTNWVQGVASTGTFVKNSAATWDVSGVNGIPSGWTVQEA